MTKRSPSQTVHCIDRELSCQLFLGTAVRAGYRHCAVFVIWPEGSSFLRKGIIEELLLNNQNHLSHGFIFVDLSLPNLCLFTDSQWADRLAHGGMHIVLIADRSLASLVDYWLSRSNKIQGIIYPDNNDEVQHQKIR